MHVHIVLPLTFCPLNAKCNHVHWKVSWELQLEERTPVFKSNKSLEMKRTLKKLWCEKHQSFLFLRQPSFQEVTEAVFTPTSTVCLKQKPGANYREVFVVCVGVNVHPNRDVNPTDELQCSRNQGVDVPAAELLLQSDPNIGNEQKNNRHYGRRKFLYGTHEDDTWWTEGKITFHGHTSLSLKYALLTLSQDNSRSTNQSQWDC